VKDGLGYEPLSSTLDGLHPDAKRRYWIERLEAHEGNCDIEVETGQMSTGVEILGRISHNILDENRGVFIMRSLHLKIEIAQRELSDLGRENHAEA